jgi:hypothetical protein
LLRVCYSCDGMTVLPFADLVGKWERKLVPCVFLSFPAKYGCMFKLQLWREFVFLSFPFDG